MLRKILSNENVKDDSRRRHHEVSLQVFEDVLLGRGEVGDDDAKNKKKPPILVGAIDQGTSSTRFMVFTRGGRVAAVAQMEHQQHYPPAGNGWHEHDPFEIWDNVTLLMRRVAIEIEQSLKKNGMATVTATKLAAIGITNQRETTIAWNKTTGACYHRAIVWDDARTTGIASQLADGNIQRIAQSTGLPLASYFAGTKVKWLLDNVDALRSDLSNPQTRDQVCFGTIDSWLLYQLTGSAPASANGSNGAPIANRGGVHCTDVSNASRWLFMNLETCKWDPSLIDFVCAPHSVPVSALPTIRPSSHLYGTLNPKCGVNHPWLDNVPIASILGDQQAALFGQTAFEPGDAKNTYGTGLFLMLNTGTTPVPSKHGLLTTVAYQLGADSPVHYALEGSVSHAGATVQWLRDQMQIITSASESRTLATPQNDGLYMVPAFGGLFAPHWRSNARACIVGITAAHHRGHICRAALEAAAYQTKEVFDAIVADSSVQLKSLKVDGGMTHNPLLMQFQADMLQVNVVQPVVMETTSIGAAFAAGLAVGVWKDLDEIKALWGVAKVYEPRMSDAERSKNWAGWTKAVTRSWDWVDDERLASTDEDEGEKFEDCLEFIDERRSGISWGWYAFSIVAVSVAATAAGFVAGRSTLRRSK